jgi:TfoX/Sxy family transcriptional regulator of competence genes
MAIDEALASRVRAALADATTLREVKMFGGLGFMVRGNLIACADQRGLLVRVGEVGRSAALARGAKAMVMNGRQMKGFVRVEGTLDTRTVRSWLRVARAYVETLPTKTSGAGPARKTRSKS